MLLLAASGGRAAALLCRRAAAVDHSRAAAARRGGTPARGDSAAATHRRPRQAAMLAAAPSSSTSSSSSSSSSPSASTSSSPAPSPLDAVSPDQALLHPTLRALDPASLERNVKYLDLVLKADAEGLNMTAVRRRGPALLRHCADSLDLLPFIDREEQRWLDSQQQQQRGEEEEEEAGGGGPGKSREKAPFTVVDVGSGGGFPGAALAAARPAWRLVLIDALRKRCDAVSDAVKRAGIRNAEVVWSRAEEAAAATVAADAAGGGGGGGDEKKRSSSSSPSLRESSPVVVARAVAELRTLAELCLPLVSPGGAWIAPKGPPGPGSQLELELEAARAAVTALGGRVEAVEPLPPLVPGAPARSVVVVRKVGATPAKYPRGNNLPGRRPL